MGGSGWSINTKKMKYIFFILLLLLNGSFTSKPGCAKLDIIIVADISGSVDGSEDYLNNAIISFIDGIDISEDGIRIGVVSFNDDSWLELKLTGDHDYFDSNFKRLNAPNAAGTHLSTGLFTAMNEFETSGRKDIPKLIIVISDGDIQDHDEVVNYARNISVEGVVMCGLMIKDGNSDDSIFKEIMGGCYFETDFQSLIKDIQKIDICL